MASPTILLELAETISKASLIITKNNLLLGKEPPSFQATHTGPSPPVVNGNGPAINGNGLTKQKSSVEDLSEQTIHASASLIQATTDLQILVSGPDNYLKSLSYAVCQIPVPIHCPPTRSSSKMSNNSNI